MATSPQERNSRKQQIAAIDGQHRDLSMATIAFHEAVARRLGMTAAERKCLGMLGKLQTCTPGQLAQATGLTTGAITGIVDRLESSGFLRREPNPHDRRSMLLQPLRTKELGRLTEPVFRSLGAAMADLAATYSDRELDVILRHITATTNVLRREIVAVQTQAPAIRLTSRKQPLTSPNHQTSGGNTDHTRSETPRAGTADRTTTRINGTKRQAGAATRPNADR